MTEIIMDRIRSAMNLTFIFSFVLLSFGFYESPGNAAPAQFSVPVTHKIPRVPKHKQISASLCGPCAIQTVFNFWGNDIKQKAIANVARSFPRGTITSDISRTGHFSYLSSARGSYFPRDIPDAGFAQRQIGYASFNYSSDTLWWDDLKTLIASNIPVVLLMKYAPYTFTGHYMVMVGYDETKKVVYLLDPWDRDQTRAKDPDGTVTWKMSDFENAWDYCKYGATHPFWGAVMMPWHIDIMTDGVISMGSELNVVAKITYPCPMPFDHTAFPASDSKVSIILPEGIDIQEGITQVNIGTLKAGDSNIVRWKLRIYSLIAGASISIKAVGLISGEVPDIIWPGGSYPAYNYSDQIGGEASLKIN